MSQESDVPQSKVDIRRARLRRWRWPLLASGPVIIALIAGYITIEATQRQSTDNAYVQITRTPVSSGVDGRIVEVFVNEDQPVRRGQALFRLDTSAYQATVDADTARLADAEMQVRVQLAAYRQQQANVTAAREMASFAAAEATRQRKMAAAGVASRQQAEEAAHAAQQARSQLVAAEQQALQALANLGGSPDRPVSAHPAVMKARADLEHARIDVRASTIHAPADGLVSGVRRTPPGTYVKEAQTTFWLLSGQPWVEANFKEDQLKRMRLGQPAKIKVDAYSGGALDGKVTDIAPATGATFSVLPAQNATGNWVKVVQRVPVRIDFDHAPPGMVRRAGLSSKVTVDVSAPGREP